MLYLFKERLHGFHIFFVAILFVVNSICTFQKDLVYFCHTLFHLCLYSSRIKHLIIVIKKNKLVNVVTD